MNNQEKNLKQNDLSTNNKEKGPINFFVGSITSLSLFVISLKISNNLAIYFSIHKPNNESEVVQNISASFNTLIIGLAFLATFSFAFIGLGLFIVFIRSFFLEKNLNKE
tara:strand:- start:23203 stop:23529 length:327 start_codon:yes stop_codon:yes gene_type:complete